MFCFLVLDASGKVNDGYLQGNFKHSGNINQCKAIRTPDTLSLNEEILPGFKYVENNDVEL